MRVWGITGTNGKTTSAWVFAEFVNAVPGRRCGHITTVEVFDGARRVSTGYTTPPLAQLREIFAAMEANGCTDCVMEVSSHALSQNRTGETRFSGGAFTNITEDHLDYHKTMEAYFAAKLELARLVARTAETRPDMGRGDLPPFVVAMDGEGAREMFNAAGNLSVNVIGVSVAKSAYDLSRLQLVGEYNRSNVLVAAALAEAAGVPRETVQAVIPKLQPRWGRLERVANPQVAAEVYVDFAHTPDGLDKVLAAARGFTPGRLWVVFGAGGDRDPMKRPLMGAAAAKRADRIVLTSDNPRSEDPLAIIEAVAGGVPAGVWCVREPDRRKAIRLALGEAERGDVVVIAGKGHETTQEIAGVKHPFDDREEVRSFRGS